MKKTGIIILAAGIAILGFLGNPVTGTAGVNVSIGFFAPLPLPPVPVLPAPPRVVMAPRTEVYYAPDVDLDIFFYRGHWYRPHEGRWYRSRGYNGPWHSMAPRYVPRPVVSVFPDRHYRGHKHYKVPYGQYKKHWRERHGEGWDD